MAGEPDVVPPAAAVPEREVLLDVALGRQPHVGGVAVAVPGCVAWARGGGHHCKTQGRRTVRRTIIVVGLAGRGAGEQHRAGGSRATGAVMRAEKHNHGAVGVAASVQRRRAQR